MQPERQEAAAEAAQLQDLVAAYYIVLVKCQWCAQRESLLVNGSRSLVRLAA